MKYKANLRPYGRLLFRYFSTLKAIERLKKGVTRDSLGKVLMELNAFFLAPLSEHEIIARLKQMEQSFFGPNKAEFKRYLKKHFGIDKLPTDE